MLNFLHEQEKIFHNKPLKIILIPCLGREGEDWPRQQERRCLDGRGRIKIVRDRKNIMLHICQEGKLMWSVMGGQRHAIFLQRQQIPRDCSELLFRVMSSTATPEQKPPCPPFTLETAIQKVRMAEDAWNTRNPDKVKMAYTVDSKWRNRNVFLNGREEIKTWLRSKWDRELDYRLIKELWCYTDNKIAVRFAYEYHDDSGNWFRAYGNENWEFDENGFMAKRHASINDLPIKESERKFHWPSDSRRPDDHPSLSDLGL